MQHACLDVQCHLPPVFDCLPWLPGYPKAADFTPLNPSDMLIYFTKVQKQSIQSNIVGNSEPKEVNLSSIHLLSWIICKSNKNANKEITFICSLVTWQKQLKDGMFAQFEVSSLSQYIKHCSKIRRHLYSLSRCLKATCWRLICFLQIIPYITASHSLILTTLRGNLPASRKSMKKLPHRPTQRFFP